MLFEQSKNLPIIRHPEPITSTLPFALKHPKTHKRILLEPQSSTVVSVFMNVNENSFDHESHIIFHLPDQKIQFN